MRVESRVYQETKIEHFIYVVICALDLPLNLSYAFDKLLAKSLSVSFAIGFSFFFRLEVSLIELWWLVSKTPMDFVVRGPDRLERTALAHLLSQLDAYYVFVFVDWFASGG
jgi:hypothetical protein